MYELENTWNLDDVMRANAVLDMKAELTNASIPNK